MTVAFKSFVVITASMWLSACSRPPLHVRQEGQSFVIDVQTLGEYPTDVAGMRRIEASRNVVVWEVKGRNRAQLGRFTIRVGENPTLPTDVRHGAYDLIAPAGKQTFTIAPGTRYVFEVWSSETAPDTRRTAQFETPTG